MAWMKLRRRNSAPLLNANGWAINAESKISIPFGETLTDVAKYPKMRLKDPYAKKGTPGWVKVLVTLLVIAAAAGAVWYLSGTTDWIPQVFEFETDETWGERPVVGVWLRTRYAAGIAHFDDVRLDKISK